MTDVRVPSDPLWPRAAQWLRPATSGAGASEFRLAVLGVPTHRSSITPTGAHATPAAVRDALARYSTYSASQGVDVAELDAADYGDVGDPDGRAGEARVKAAVARVVSDGCDLLVALGGDNSATFSVMSGLVGDAWGEWGLITIDAHHDVRDGETNGSPVRRLIEAGLPGERIVQIGIADFSNSAAYAARASTAEIRVVTRSEVAERPIGEIAIEALDVAGAGGRRVFVDVDVDVCDRAVVPACPSAAPGGMSAHELRRLVFELARDPRVVGLDITEIDATIDAHDQRTVRLAALLVLEAAAGLRVRLGNGG